MLIQDCFKYGPVVFCKLLIRFYRINFFDDKHSVSFHLFNDQNLFCFFFHFFFSFSFSFGESHLCCVKYLMFKFQSGRLFFFFGKSTVVSASSFNREQLCFYKLIPIYHSAFFERFSFSIEMYKLPEENICHKF